MEIIMQIAADAPRGARSERAPQRSQNPLLEEPENVTADSMNCQALVLWRALARRLREPQVNDLPRSATYPLDEMLQCFQSGRSWQDALDQGTEESGVRHVE